MRNFAFVLLLCAAVAVRALAASSVSACGAVRELRIARNGGALAVDLRVRVGEPLRNVLSRAATALGALPADCTPFSWRRPRRAHERELLVARNATRPACDERAVVDSWLQRSRLLDAHGRVWQRTADAFASPLYFVPAGEHWTWPGVRVGHRVPVADLVVDGRPVEIETLALEPRLFELSHFVTAAEADAIVAHARDRLSDSLVSDLGENTKLASRNSRQTWLACRSSDDPAEKLACELNQRMADVLRIPLTHIQRASDPLQVVHYDEQQHYHSHHDYFDPTLSPDAAELRYGQQRFLTLFFYLNDVEEGGETNFPRAGNGSYGRGPLPDMSDCSRGVKVKPEKGKAALWYNLKAAGNQHEGFLDMMSLHGGCDVIKGEKWAANGWVYNFRAGEPPGGFRTDYLMSDDELAEWTNDSCERDDK